MWKLKQIGSCVFELLRGNVFESKITVICHERDAKHILTLLNNAEHEYNPSKYEVLIGAKKVHGFYDAELPNKL